MARISKPHINHFFNTKLPDFRPLALYKHKDLTVHTEGDDDLVYDEMAERQAGRPVLGNRCLQYVAGATITFESITGTLYGLTKVAGVWAWRDMSSLLSGLVLTMDAAHTHYGAFRDDDWFMNCEDGFELRLSSDINLKHATLNSDTVRDLQGDKPYLGKSGDAQGYSLNSVLNVNQSDTLQSPSLIVGGAYLRYRLADVNMTDYTIYLKTSGSLDPDLMSDGKRQAWLENDGVCRIKLNAGFSSIVTFATNVASDINYDLTVLDGQVKQIFCLDYSILTGFNDAIKDEYGLTNNIYGDVPTMKDLYWILAADDPNNDGTGDTTANGGSNHGVNYPATLGWTGATTTRIRELFADVLNVDGVLVLDFIEKMHLNNHSFNDLGSWASTILVKSSILPLNFGVGDFKGTITTQDFSNNTIRHRGDDIGWFQVNHNFLQTYDININSNSSLNLELEIRQLEVKGITALPRSKNGNFDVEFERELQYPGPRDWPAQNNSDGSLNLAYEFWNRPAEWDNYIPGQTESDTVMERNNGSSIDRICVFQNAPQNEQLTRAQRFTKDKI